MRSEEWFASLRAVVQDLAEFYSDKIKAEKKKNAAGTLVKDVMSTRLFTTTTGTPVEKVRACADVSVTTRSI